MLHDAVFLWDFAHSDIQNYKLCNHEGWVWRTIFCLVLLNCYRNWRYVGKLDTSSQFLMAMFGPVPPCAWQVQSDFSNTTFTAKLRRQLAIGLSLGGVWGSLNTLSCKKSIPKMLGCKTSWYEAKQNDTICYDLLCCPRGKIVLDYNTVHISLLSRHTSLDQPQHSQ